MNKVIIILFCVLIFGIIFFTGCIEENVSVEPNNSQTEAQIEEETVSLPETSKKQESSHIPEPDETINEYVFSFNNLQTEYLYINLLSDELKKEKSEDEVHNLIYGYKLQRIKIIKYNVINKTITGNIVTMEIEFVWDVQGFRQTVTKNVTLLLEDNKWKIADEIITM